MGRAPCCDKNNVKKGPWAPEEDEKLKYYIEKHGFSGNWIALPQKIGLKRCGKSCRLRWLNYLRPNIKHGGFTEEEDKIISNLYVSIGSRWSVIAAQLPGRTDNDIKNYWNTKLKKKMFGKQKQTLLDRLSIAQGYQNDGHNLELEYFSSPYLQNLSTSAIERLQLNMHLQSTIPFYNNNPSFFPKLNLNPIQEKMLQNSQPIMNNNQKFEAFHNTKFHGQEDVNGVLNGCENGGFLPSQGGEAVAKFESCHQGMVAETSRDQLLWWANEFDSNSPSSISNSWDSASLTFQSAGEMNQDFNGEIYNHINNNEAHI